MKAISYYQPYAWMIANGHLDIDDRTWGTSHRGPLLIHASKSFEPNYYHFVKHILEIDIPPPEELEYGGFVAKVNLVDCLKPGAPTEVPHERRAHGGAHCYGWVVTDVEKLPFSPFRGERGLFEVDYIKLQNEKVDTRPKQVSLF